MLKNKDLKLTLWLKVNKPLKKIKKNKKYKKKRFWEYSQDHIRE